LPDEGPDPDNRRVTRAPSDAFQGSDDQTMLMPIVFDVPAVDAPGQDRPESQTRAGSAAGVAAGVAGMAVTQTVQAGFRLVRVAAGVGLRLARLGGGPLALDSGALGRATASLAPLGPAGFFRRDHGPEARSPRVVVRAAGKDVDLDGGSLDRAFPHAGDRLLVLLPGIGETEEAWSRGSEAVGGTYASRLAQLLDWTPVHLRTDLGFSAHENGVAVSATVQRLVDGWPLDVRRIALLGHGSGGLVARSACAVLSLAGPEGETRSRAWTDLVTDVVALDTPHLVSDSASGLPIDPIGLASVLDERLAGITGKADVRIDVPPLRHARYHVVNDSVTTNKNAVGQLLGGLLWWRQTAVGRSRQAWALFPSAAHHVLSTREFPLVNHPEVQRGLLSWLR